MAAPTPDDVRAALAGFDPLQQKVVAGLFALMIRSPERVREREWIARQLTEVVVMAGGFEADTPEEGVRAVQEWLHAHAEEIVRGALLLFQRVGLDLAGRPEAERDHGAALRLAVGYLPV